MGYHRAWGKHVIVVWAPLLPSSKLKLTMYSHHLSLWGMVRSCLLTLEGGENKRKDRISAFFFSLCVLETKKASEPLQKNQRRVWLWHSATVTERRLLWGWALFHFSAIPFFKGQLKARLWTYHYLIKSRTLSSPNKTRFHSNSILIHRRLMTENLLTLGHQNYQHLMARSIFSSRQRGNHAFGNFCLSADDSKIASNF